MVERDDVKYVTYKSLLVSIGSAVSLILIVFGLYVNHMDKKVNKEVYDRDYGRMCKDLDAIKETVDGNQKIIDKVNANQILVLRHLRIEPVK